MKLIKLSLAAAMAVTFAYAQEASEVGVSANMSITSNYVWRGMSQTNDSPAVQGGIDLDYKGVYVGVWGSNVEFGKASLEADAYIGYANEISGFSYDVGYVQFMYPNLSDELNFGEAYIKLGYDFEVVSVGAAYYMGVDTNDWKDVPDTIEASVSVPLPAEITLDGTYGSYGDDDGFGDYYSLGVSKSFGKFDFTLAYTAMDWDADGVDTEDNFVATVGTSF